MEDSFFEALLEAAPDAILLVDEGGRIVLVNRRTEEIFGYPRDALVGGKVEQLIPERFRSAHADHRHQYAAHPAFRPMGIGLELYGRRRDGSEFPVEISLSPVSDPGDRSHVLTIVRDVGERILAENERQARIAAEAARASREALLRDLDAIVWESASPQRETYTFVSGRVEELLGYQLESWTGEPGFWSRIIHPEDREATQLFFAEMGAEERHDELVYRVLAVDGRTVWVRDIVRVSPTAGGRLVRGVMVDVTERRELETRLFQSQKMEAVGQLAGGIAHDFNNLLTVIRGYAHLLGERIPDEAHRRDLAAIGAAAERAADLARQLLAFSRRAPQRVEIFDLGSLVRSLDPMLRRLISEDIDLSISTANEPIDINGDRTHIEQVVMNLVVNACDALTKRGSIRLVVERVEPSKEEARRLGLEPGSCARLVVSDSGIGMDEETLARIFEPFFTTKPVGKGTGLGLSTVYGIVEQAGGRLDVRSEPGRGTDVAVYLPLATRPPDEEEAPVGPTATILVAEDEDSLRGLATSILQQQNWQVLEARDGREALEVARLHDGRIDLLLTDVVMPGLNGPELARHLEGIRPDLPVLYMSGYADSALLRRTERDVPLVRKPFDPPELVERVRTSLGRTARRLPAPR